MTSKKSIVIVGAGISGLQAAHTFLTHPSAKSLDVIVLEARNRIGGRVNSKCGWGIPLDYGASYIHGTEENPLTELVRTVGATLIPRKSSDPRVYFDDDGDDVATSDAQLIYGKCSQYADDAIAFSREHNVHKDVTVGSFFDECIMKDLDLTTDKIRDMVSNAVEMLSHSAACDLDKLSLKFYWTDDDLPGERAFIDSSYDAVLQHIARPALSQNIIKFNVQINAIDVSSPDKPIVLRSTAGETFNADAVLVTVPLGSLKQNQITFSPSLPPCVQNAISSLGYGVLERLFIRFSQSWWLTSPHDPAKIYLESFRFSSLKSTTKHIPRGTMNFFSLARAHNPQPIFMVFVATELARFLTSLSNDSLQAILQTYYIPLLPNYDPDNPICQILEVDCSSWCHNLFSGFGAYTHIPAGSENGPEDMNILSEKIFGTDNGGVWFAGEHTARVKIVDELMYSNLGTVTGAYQSGIRAANDILNSFV